MRPTLAGVSPIPTPKGNPVSLIAILQAIATGLRDTLGPRVNALLTENAALRNRVAELEEVDLRESAAAQGVAEAYNDVVGVLDHTDDVETPEPIAEPSEAVGVDDLPTEAVAVPPVPNPAELDTGEESAQ